MEVSREEDRENEDSECVEWLCGFRPNVDSSPMV